MRHPSPPRPPAPHHHPALLHLLKNQFDLMCISVITFCKLSSLIDSIGSPRKAGRRSVYALRILALKNTLRFRRLQLYGSQHTFSWLKMNSREKGTCISL